MGVSSCSFKGLWSTGQRCHSRSMCTFLVEREQLFVLKSQRLCDLLRFNLVYNIRMKLTEALWAIPGNLVFLSFSACHCQYVPSCLGLAPRPIGISTTCLFPSGPQPKRCLYHRANLTLPTLILLIMKTLSIPGIYFRCFPWKQEMSVSKHSRKIGS